MRTQTPCQVLLIAQYSYVKRVTNAASVVQYRANLSVYFKIKKPLSLKAAFEEYTDAGGSGEVSYARSICTAERMIPTPSRRLSLVRFSAGRKRTEWSPQPRIINP